MPKMTLADDGSPSDDPYKDLQRSLELAEDERYLVAYDLYEDVRRRVKDWESEQGVLSPSSSSSPVSLLKSFRGNSAKSNKKDAASVISSRSKEPSIYNLRKVKKDDKVNEIRNMLFQKASKRIRAKEQEFNDLAVS